MKKIIYSLAILALSTTATLARVTSIIPATIAEGKVLILKGKNFNSGSEPLAASLKTTDGTTVTLDTEIVSAAKFKVTMPSVTTDTKAVLRISGGNTTASVPQESLILILDKPDEAFENPDNGDDLVALPSSVTTDLHANTATSALTVTSATQSSITTLPSLTSVGGSGQNLTLYGTIIAPSGIQAAVTSATTAATVTTAAQPNITTLAAFVNGGTAGTNTKMKGKIIAEQGMNGNVIGNLTGNVTGNVTGNLTGNVTGNVSGTATGITTATSLATSGTIIQRNANGDFAAGDITSNGQVVATTFNGIALKALTDVSNGTIAARITDGTPANTINVTNLNLVTLDDSTGSNDALTTITGGRIGQRLTILFIGGDITTVTDNNSGTTNTININDLADDVSGAGSSNGGSDFNTGDALHLIFNGTSWYEIGRSMNYE